MRFIIGGLSLLAIACVETQPKGGNSTTGTDANGNETIPVGTGNQVGSTPMTNADGSVQAPGQPPTTTPPEPEGPPAIQFLGRFDKRDPAGPQCSWPGCRIQARFEGTSANVTLNEHIDSWMVAAPSEWDVSIDGVLQPKLVLTAGQNTYPIAANLPAGKHSIELFKRSESQAGVTQFIGLDLAGGTLLAPPAKKARKIEIIGDSNPAGFGIEGVGFGPDCPGLDYAAQWENFHKSWGAKLGELLDADVLGTVYSGKGMAKNIWHPDNETMPVIFGRTNPNDANALWDFSEIPDVVVIMIGGNDFAIGQPEDTGPATLEQFTTAYTSFLGDLRTHYPNAWIFPALSSSVTDEQPAGRSSRTNVLAGMTEAVSRRNDPKVQMLVPPVATPGELTGCNGHGSPEHHARVAVDLSVPIRTALRW